MTPAARIQAAIEVLAALETTQRPADRFLRDWFRARRYAGSKDRAAVAERVFLILRHRASLAWRMQSETPRALAIASLLHEEKGEAEIEALFDGTGYGPKPLSGDERDALARPLRDSPPDHVRGEYPQWLEPELLRAFGDDLVAEMEPFAARAPIDLRVNALKATRDEVLAALNEDGFDASATPFAPYGIRLPPGEGGAALQRHALFACGAFEFQDEAAQIAAHLCEARPGMRVLDLAAGAGGKSLALAADMNNKGEIVACDIREDALAELASRATRAGVSVVRTCSREPPEAEFDIVLVDAPCSGSGTWRRQPELKWRLTPQRLEEYCRTQNHLLEVAASRVRVGGRLVYSTCSILPAENDDRIAQFLGTHPSFVVVPAQGGWRAVTPKQQASAFFVASPRRTSTDGFFAAVLERSAE